MTTIENLKRALEKVITQEAQVANAKYPIGIVIDLHGPEGNIWHLRGMCKHILRQLHVDADTTQQFKYEIKNKKYSEQLDIMQKWFGIVYLNRPEE